MVKLYLEKEGMDVLVANDGKSGVDLFNTSSPQLVLLDIMMPGIDGVEAVSYTHLDVYKRQILHRPLFSRQ